MGPRDVPPVGELPEAVRAAIRSPIGAPALSELVARHGTDTVVLVDDGTRSTPQRLILPVLLDGLNEAGVPDRDVTVLIALGTHRPMTEADRDRSQIRWLSKKDLMGEVRPWANLHGFQLALPFTWNKWRVLRLYEI